MLFVKAFSTEKGVFGRGDLLLHFGVTFWAFDFLVVFLHKLVDCFLSTLALVIKIWQDYSFRYLVKWFQIRPTFI